MKIVKVAVIMGSISDMPINMEHEVKIVSAHLSGKPVENPIVYIPVFPGTNCEYDTAKTFATATTFE